jgi:membrane-bound metal-dependent hydrolase YbcI (DUF457 family)
MPTPVGHSLAGLAVHLAGGAQTARRPWLAALALVAIANLPDVDFLPGYLIGEPRAYHWGPTHSFAAAIMVGVAAGAVAHRFTGRFLPFFLLATTAYATHLLLDVQLGPGAPSKGLELFWPFTRERYMAPWALFRMMPASIESVGPVGALFDLEVIPIIAREIAILAPVCFVAWILGAVARSARNPAAAERVSP